MASNIHSLKPWNQVGLFLMGQKVICQIQTELLAIQVKCIDFQLDLTKNWLTCMLPAVYYMGWEALP